MRVQDRRKFVPHWVVFSQRQKLVFTPATVAPLLSD
ncbi:hypothetical protein CXB51_023198 [Gossypium anomalum]|uniref:Uncharacterized protein n=1 Tax=Gossypium anomalum TaxID=47600 RepID=A0A8J6CQC0_9ROSI|nr:hypothetical protein CXB51_023198 [Gossypium anomalum]